ncbi:hypothetical protein ACELLULO517_15135 [Acidisoma cellulosilytica]|uniref:Secreted protein n=1 Tax=Acidisoma cellulosilyticum TaxID=2802395 RepID=A0A964E4Q2_9PROT|nr:hypothetical protein [Acidisoma cellulosilyticum]MCB8881582.1 hypothetical protein [Acidisoma cellulosilyticum]
MKPMVAAVGFLLLSAMPALAANMALCGPTETDAAPRPLPQRLIDMARTSFGYTQMPADVVTRMTVFRCAAGQPLLCSLGANLPCGKANAASSLPAVTQYCAANPQSDVVPAYVAGHDSLYQWRCADGRALASSPAALDAQGYFAEYWKAVNP